MHIPFPEKLPDDVWFEKMKQLKWLTDVGIIGYGNKST
jgi:hypothetical protein